jgi:biotin transport system substrate-specific component
MHNRRLSVRAMAFSAAGVALLSIASWTTITITTVPFTLQTFAVALIVMVMSPSLAVFTIALYLVLGALGLPVFAGMTGGLSHLVGPYGGYLAGFFFGALAASAVLRGGRTLARDAVAGLVCLAVSHVLGVVWLAFSLSMTPLAAVTVGSLQFLLPDLAKCALAVLVAREVLMAVPQVAAATLLD